MIPTMHPYSAKKTARDEGTAPDIRSILDAALDGRVITQEEALCLLQGEQEETSLSRHASVQKTDLKREKALRHLQEVADAIRQRQTGDDVLYTTGQSLYLTNLCELGNTLYPYARTSSGENGAFILSIDEIDAALDRSKTANEKQLYISSGGYWPSLCIPGLERPTLLKTYGRVLEYIREKAPDLKITGFSPDELDFLSIVCDRSERYLLEYFSDYGLCELGGQGVEILVDSVRQKVSPKKATVKRWFDIVATAHQCNIPVVARLEGGHFETLSQRITHLERLRRFLKTHPGAFSRFEPAFGRFVAPATLRQDSARATQEPTAYPGSQRNTLADRQRLLAVTRLFLGEALPNQQTFRGIDSEEEAQEGLQWGANVFGSSDATAYERFLRGQRTDERLSESELQQLIRETHRSPHLF